MCVCVWCGFFSEIFHGFSLDFYVDFSPGFLRGFFSPDFCMDFSLDFCVDFSPGFLRGFFVRIFVVGFFQFELFGYLHLTPDIFRRFFRRYYLKQNICASSPISLGILAGMEGVYRQ